MHITCPSCNKSFIASKEQIGIPGRRVKCSNCQYIWFQRLDLSTKLTEPGSLVNDTGKNDSTNTKEEKTANKIYLPALLPAKIPETPSMLNIASLCIIIVCLLLVLYDDPSIPNWHLDNNALNIENIKTTQNKMLGQVKVSYRITNRSKYDVTVPLIRIRLLDEKHQPIKSYIMAQKNIRIKPSKNVDIATTLDVVPPSSNLLDIMLGNSLDFILQ